jgi:hypothetical protein
MSFKNVYGGRHATRVAEKIAQRTQYAYTQPAQLVRKEIIELGYEDSVKLYLRLKAREDHDRA